jgi:tRNA1(Val) A37 N6-methylase TrmN6
MRGKVKIIQKKLGYRFSIDAILLWDFAQVGKKSRIVDLGTGVGIIAVL